MCHLNGLFRRQLLWVFVRFPMERSHGLSGRIVDESSEDVRFGPNGPSMPDVQELRIIETTLKWVESNDCS